MISLGCFDIAQSIMSFYRFRHCPRIGHVEQLKRVCGYIRKYPQGAIRFRTDIPDHEYTFGANPIKYDWVETVYGNPTEEIPNNMPTPKGRCVNTSTYCDANLLHDLTT